jgi:hypothetical protein
MLYCTVILTYLRLQPARQIRAFEGTGTGLPAADVAGGGKLELCIATELREVNSHHTHHSS